MSSPTFSDVAQRNRLRMEALGIPLSRYTLEVSLLQVMSSVGELATLSCNTALDLSKFEREEVNTLIGRLTVSLATLSEIFEVSAEAAALHYLDEEERAASRFAAPTHGIVDAADEDRDVGMGLNGATDENGDQMSPGTPLTVDGFYEKVSQLATLPREVFEAQDVRWVMPGENGELKELIPGGAQRRVTPEEYTLFMNVLQLHRGNHDSPMPEPLHPSPTGGGAARAPTSVVPSHPVYNRVETQVAQPFTDPNIKVVGYDAVRDMQLFSPSHFSGGLFSPMANAADIRTMTDVRPPASTARSVNQPAAAYVPPQHLQGSTEPPAGVHARAPINERLNNTGREQSPISQQLFFDYVDKLRTGTLTPQQIARLRLTFAVPDKDNLLVPLVSRGESITVSAANVNEFLRLVDLTASATGLPDAARTATSNSGQAHNAVRRTSSMYRLEVQNRLANDRQDFSPTHFSHGLFAPNKPASVVYVDYDEGEQMLPPYLRQAAAQRREDQQRSQSAPTARAASETTAIRDTYVSACRRGDVAAVQSMINEVKKNPQAATTCGLTYCAPSCMVAGASDAQRISGLYALYPNSEGIPVDPNNVGTFLLKLREVTPALA